MNLSSVVVLVLLGFAGGGIAIINRRNRMEFLDPETLVLSLNDDFPERVLPLEGAVNFRDLGGYRTSDGRRIRTGLIYRSAGLHRLTESDHAHLHQIGLKLVCDLRSAEEVALEPDRLPQNSAPEYLHLPLNSDDQREQRERLIALLFNRRTLAPMMADYYVRVMIEANAHVYGTILNRLANQENLPTVIHCTAGKDRTGIAAALILSVLGVPEETIIVDYSLSNRYYDNYFKYAVRLVHGLRWLGIRPEHLQPLLLANPDNLRAALKHICDRYGSTENYLRQKAGVTDEEIAALHANLLE
jgi:protein-tyrosine phosphatase